LDPWRADGDPWRAGGDPWKELGGGGTSWEELEGGGTSLALLDGRRQWKRGGSPLEIRRQGGKCLV